MMDKESKKWLPVAIAVLVIVGLFVFRDSFVRYSSALLTERQAEAEKKALDREVSAKYNYSRNGEKYGYTFWEFGTSDCISCRKMETVMKEVKSEYAEKVNVVFVDISKPENRGLADYYGIVMIPAQVLLNRDGKEYYRHTGIISFEDLKKYFDK